MKKLLHLSSILWVLGMTPFYSAAQDVQIFSSPTKNWQNESIEEDSVYGTGSDDALKLLKGRKSTTVIVAVIDGGVYINHPAIKDNIWVNSKEIPDNKIDDDHNGYVDDVHGWDFIGGKDSDVRYDNIELTRLYRYLGKKYADVSPDKVAKRDKDEYKKYLHVKDVFEGRRDKDMEEYAGVKGFVDTVGLLKSALGKKDFTEDDLDKYKPTDSTMARAKSRLIRDFKLFSIYIKGITADSIIKLVQPFIDQLNVALKYQYNVDFDPRYIVGDNYANDTQRCYGNNDVVGPTDVHGTHVSGIIAGRRTGVPGAQEGIADNVKIMVVRVVPDGDERDKDVANGIRYAVDNGAKVINMSFGKGFSYDKKVVDDAVKYAEAHDVLLIHAAGNDHKDNDSNNNFPNPRFEGSHKQADNWIEVGASDNKGYPGEFSNYGKKTVDLFAPGVKIYSSVPDSSYAYFDGTSMASPCVSGVAAIIREYFPKLTAKQVKKILMKSVRKVNFKVPMPGHKGEMVMYSDLCVSGGIINADKAVQLALKKAGK